METAVFYLCGIIKFCIKTLFSYALLQFSISAFLSGGRIDIILSKINFDVTMQFFIYIKTFVSFPLKILCVILNFI